MYGAVGLQLSSLFVHTHLPSPTSNLGFLIYISVYIINIYIYVFVINHKIRETGKGEEIKNDVQPRPLETCRR